MMKPFILCMLIAFSCVAMAQDQSTPDQEDDAPGYYHQIFLDDTLKSIEKIEYRNETGEPVEYHISEDKTAIHIFNYNGRNRVDVNYTNTAGKAQNISKPSCHIHALPTL